MSLGRETALSGKFLQSFQHVEEALGYFRELSIEDTRGHAFNLANALVLHSIMLLATGRTVEGRNTAEEAECVALHRSMNQATSLEYSAISLACVCNKASQFANSACTDDAVSLLEARLNLGPTPQSWLKSWLDLRTDVPGTPSRLPEFNMHREQRTPPPDRYSLLFTAAQLSVNESARTTQVDASIDQIQEEPFATVRLNNLSIVDAIELVDRCTYMYAINSGSGDTAPYWVVLYTAQTINFIAVHLVAIGRAAEAVRHVQVSQFFSCRSLAGRDAQPFFSTS